MLSFRTLVGAGVVVFAALLSPAQAAITVTNTSDSGAGSLRDAIATAAPNDTIVFAPGVTGSILLLSPLAVTQSVTIQGPGASALTLDGQNTVGVINLSGGNLAVSGLAIANGKSAGLGGGVDMTGTSGLSAKNVHFIGNAASNGGAISVGAGDTLNVDESTFTANTTTGVGGGAIILFGPATITDSTFVDNTAPINGGAINVQGAGTLTAYNDTFFDNTSGSLGGALSNLGTTTISDSTLAGNHGSSGAAIATGNANATLNNSVVVDNVAAATPGALDPNPFPHGSFNVFFNNTAAGVADDQTGYGTSNPVIAMSEPLAPFGQYGGPTQTMPPLAGGAAVCAASPSLLPPGLTWDQENFPRTTLTATGGVCLDAGADQLSGPSTFGVPTLSTSMLVLLGVLLAGFGVQRARRRAV